MSFFTTPRRGRTFVDPQVQGGMLQKIALHWVLLFSINSMAIVMWVWLFEQPDMSWGEIIANCVRRFMPFFVISIVLIPAFIWDTLKITNRFAGPILRLRSALADAAQGKETEPLQFRNNDFWQDIANDFNGLVQRSRDHKSVEDGTAS